MKATFDSKTGPLPGDPVPRSASELSLPSLLMPLKGDSFNHYLRAVLVCAGAVLTLATLALVGQFTGWIWLAGGDKTAGIVPMAPVTAFTFLVLGAALLATARAARSGA